jgi:hypothetical protein
MNTTVECCGTSNAAAMRVVIPGTARSITPDRPKIIQYTNSNTGGITTILLLYVGKIKASSNDMGEIAIVKITIPFITQSNPLRFALKPVRNRKIATSGQPRPIQRITLRPVLTQGVSGRMVIAYHYCGNVKESPREIGSF